MSPKRFKDLLEDVRFDGRLPFTDPGMAILLAVIIFWE
jgi:hypothetical protein